MRESRNTLILAVIIVIGFITTDIMIYHSRRITAQGETITAMRRLAATLESHGLWAQAVKEYSKMLDLASFSADERAKINYHIGEIYIDRLSDPEGALPYLLSVKLYSTDSNLSAQADKRIVEAFEKAGRSLDAANFLASAASIEPSHTSTKEVILAKVGSKTITLRELNDEIQQLPPQLQEQFKSNEKKLEYLHSMIARKLLIVAAARAGYDNNPEADLAAQRAREAVILTKYQQKEIDPKIRITEADVRAYYEGHKDEFTTTDKNGKKSQLSYQEAKDRARAMLEAQKRRESLDEIINKLQQSEGVEIYSDRLSNK